MKHSRDWIPLFLGLANAKGSTDEDKEGEAHEVEDGDPMQPSRPVRASAVSQIGGRSGLTADSIYSPLYWQILSYKQLHLFAGGLVLISVRQIAYGILLLQVSSTAIAIALICTRSSILNRQDHAPASGLLIVIVTPLQKNCHKLPFFQEVEDSLSSYTSRCLAMKIVANL